MYKSLWAFVWLFFLYAGTAYGQVQAIDDPHNQLTVEQKAKLSKALMENYEKTKVHIVIWLPHLAKDDVLLDKAVEYFKTKGIGQKGEDNGVLILVDWDNRRSRIEVGYGLEGVMTDVMTKNIQDKTMNPFFKKKDLYGGLMAGVMGLSKLSIKSLEDKEKPAVFSEPHKLSADFIALIILVFLLIVAAVIGYIRHTIALSNERARDEKERLEKDVQKRRESWINNKSSLASTPKSGYSRKESKSSFASDLLSASIISSVFSSDDSSSRSSSSSSSYDSGGGSSGGGGSDSSWD